MEDYKSGYKLVTKPTLRQNRYICIILYINELPKPRLKNKKKEPTSVSSFERSAKGNRTPVLRMRILRPNP